MLPLSRPLASRSLIRSAVKLWLVGFRIIHSVVRFNRPARYTCIFPQPDVAAHVFISGHALRNDWNVLQLSHPAELVRDTSAWGQSRFGYMRLPSLKFMCKIHLQLEVQDSAHSPAEDSRACMLL